LILCETDWLQIYAQLFGFAKYFAKYFLGKDVRKVEVAGCRYRITANGQGLALLGFLENVSRQLKPNICLNAEDMN